MGQKEKKGHFRFENQLQIQTWRWNEQGGLVRQRKIGSTLCCLFIWHGPSLSFLISSPVSVSGIMYYFS